MIYRFTIISDEVDDFVREIQIDPEATFYDFHEAILKSVGYTNDQMTSFFICDDDWEKGKEVTLEEMDDNPEIDSWVMKDTTISELVEDEKQKLLYVFDYITERCFFIELSEIITQNLVDAFQMTNGKDFDWEQITPGQNPYEGRDPRFYKTVLCNGDTWMNSTIQSYEGGKDGAGTTGATTTGYYLKKYMNETVSLAPSNEKKKPHHFIIFRYAEILLNYAEAMDAWKDADYTDNDHPLSARAALNQVRAAADMPAITTSGDAFTESVRRERRVELAFEDHRFWDIRRWKIGDKTKAIYCIKITMENGLPVYKKELLETRNWDDKMYLYPIPQTEYYKNPNLGQNTGW